MNGTIKVTQAIVPQPPQCRRDFAVARLWITLLMIAYFVYGDDILIIQALTAHAAIYKLFNKNKHL
jgi:hypothetical protein